ncbi:MAG: YkgJ family cysteine cluster protein [Candidatus Hadarchaeota archaeon]
MNVRAPRKVSFACQRCARCCGDTPHRGRSVYMLDEEVKTITQTTGMGTPEFAQQISGMNSYKYKMKKRNGKCVFLKDGACRIYSVRPLVCQFFPFAVKKYNGDFVFEISDDCPGIGLGTHVGPEHFNRMVEIAVKKIRDN